MLCPDDKGESVLRTATAVAEIPGAAERRCLRCTSAPRRLTRLIQAMLQQWVPGHLPECWRAMRAGCLLPTRDRCAFDATSPFHIGTTSMPHPLCSVDRFYLEILSRVGLLAVGLTIALRGNSERYGRWSRLLLLI
jgi:hypothetical protein